MKIIELVVILVIAYFLFFRKEGYSYIDLPSVCDKVDSGLKCKDKSERNIDLTDKSVKDCITGENAEVSCKDKRGIYTAGKSKLTSVESNKIIDQFKTQVQPEIQQPQIQKEDLSCDTIKPNYVCMINGKPSIITPQNSKDCGELVVCRNKAGTGTKLTKVERDKILDEFKSRVKPEIQQPVFDEEFSRKSRRCKMPLETKMIDGKMLCRNDLPENMSSFISIPEPTTPPSNYIRLSEL